jgi:flagellar motor switch protein FliN/FliY
MSESVELEQFHGEALDALPDSIPSHDLRRLRDVPVEVTVEMGRTRMTVGETLDLRPGSIISLDRLAGEPVDLLVNGTPIAHGEVVVIDEQFGLRVTDVLGGTSVDALAEPVADAAPDADQG